VTGTAIRATAGHTNPAAHPGAVVLDLGCGLDGRVFRVDPAAGHRWYGLGFPDVIEVKRAPYRASGAVRLET
jgi:O-methyltransferase involved in polyketide biosynthesis